MSEPTEARPPLIQMLYDDVFLMLLLGLVIPTLLYTVWGLIELVMVPMGR